MALLSLQEFTGFRTKKKILGEKFSISKLSVGNFYKAWNVSRVEPEKIVGEISNFNLDENPLRILRADGSRWTREKRNCLNYRVELSERFL